MQWMDFVKKLHIGAATFFQLGLIRTGVNESCGMYWSVEFRLLCKNPTWLVQDWFVQTVWKVSLWVGGYVKLCSVANRNSGFCSLQFCSGMRVLFWWKDWISNCLLGISMDDLWIGLSSVMVSLRRPYSCLFCKMWSA